MKATQITGRSSLAAPKRSDSVGTSRAKTANLAVISIPKDFLWGGFVIPETPVLEFAAAKSQTNFNQRQNTIQFSKQRNSCHILNKSDTLPRSMRRIVTHLLAVLLFVEAAVFAQRGAYVKSADLDQIVQQAQTIIRGHVISARVEPHPQFPSLDTVVVTLTADRILKGTAGSTYTFRQYVWDARDIADAAAYRKGDELLLFLNPVSLHGLTSPVGLEQGRFRIVRDSKGNRFAVNGHGNAGLFDQVASKASARGIVLSPPVQAMMRKGAGRVPLSSFEDAVQSLAGGNK